MSDVESELAVKKVEFYKYINRDGKEVIAYPEGFAAEFEEVKRLVMGLKPPGYEGLCTDSEDQNSGLAKLLLDNDIPAQTVFQKYSDHYCVYWPVAYDDRVAAIYENYRFIREHQKSMKSGGRKNSAPSNKSLQPTASGG